MFRTAGIRALAAAAPLAIAGHGEAEERRRLDLELSQVVDTLAVVRGGVDQDLAALQRLDLAAAWNSGGWEIYADLQHVGGDQPSRDLIGDAQVASNIEADDGLRLFEAWAGHSFAGGRAGLKAGMIDLNGEFDVQSAGVVFLNSSHGIGPDFSQTGRNGPSIFPDTSLAVTAHARFGEAWTIRAGLFDGAPGDPDHPSRTVVELSADEGALGIVEMERSFGGRARVKVGAWGYTAAFDAIEQLAPGGAPKRLESNRGVYGIVEGQVWREAVRPEQGLSAWIRVGVANPEINPIKAYVGGGAVYAGLFRDDDQLGFAVSHAMFGGPARRAGGLEAAETIVEVTYALPVNDNLTLQPDVQYVRNPSGDPAIADALVAGVRLSWAISN
jgi:porin